MKKSILIIISLVAVFFFASTNQVMAQWSVDVNYTDNNCSCTNITSKTIEWEIRYVSNNSLYISGSKPFISNSSPYTLSENDEIVEDTQFYICVRINYFEAAVVEPCCTGYGCTTTDSDKLTNGYSSVTIIMN